MALQWTHTKSLSVAPLPDGAEVAVVKWHTCWGWHIDLTPKAKFWERKPMPAMGRSRSRKAGIKAAEEAYGALSVQES